MKDKKRKKELKKIEIFSVIKDECGKLTLGDKVKFASWKEAFEKKPIDKFVVMHGPLDILFSKKSLGIFSGEARLRLSGTLLFSFNVKIL